MGWLPIRTILLVLKIKQKYAAWICVLFWIMNLHWQLKMISSLATFFGLLLVISFVWWSMNWSTTFKQFKKEEKKKNEEVEENEREKKQTNRQTVFDSINWKCWLNKQKILCILNEHADHNPDGYSWVHCFFILFFVSPLIHSVSMCLVSNWVLRYRKFPSHSPFLTSVLYNFIA